MNIIEYKNFSLSFKDKKVVDNVSFEVEEGKVIGILGESGSGKTVTAMSLVNLILEEKKAEGEILFLGENLLNVKEEEMEKIRGEEIGCIYQDPLSSLNPVYTIENQMIEGLIKDGKINKIEAKKRALELLKKVGINDAEKVIKSYPHELSGGMRQRVLIGMAIALKPKVLICDEITTALDVTIQAQILELIKKIQKEENTTILFITHDFGVCAEICDSVIVMEKGKIVEKGDIIEIFENPKHPYTKKLLKARESKLLNKDRISNKVLLEVNNLSKEYIKEKSFFGKKKKVLKAVNNVSFKLYEGETLGIVGESGCGKSTVAKLLVRLLEKDSGEVIVDNKDIFSLKGKELRALRRDIQMIFQDPYSSLDPMMKIEKIMEEGLLQNNIKSKSESKEYIKEILKDCSIYEESLLKYPKEFSGGQRQRICIGRAISLNPKIIIGDEPISSLDVSTQEEIGKLLVKLQEEKGISYIFISHDLSVVRRISHRVIVMYLGEIVEEGLTKEIYENPKHPYT
ncbi:MAG: dipeptide ABC transporter ATP-binding protein, partial [Clostridium sp.]|uniref:dipeptide ABC transporter ATP-binding protein n=1 Tax=Clostridium sp. TaxID=1506 RepID=UPI003F3ECDA7